MTLAAKMFIKPETTVAAINLPSDVNLDDIVVGDGPADDADVVLWFVENSEALAAQIPLMKPRWDAQKIFWVFYPKKPHLGTDLGRDATWKQMGAARMRGTRQVGIDDLWSCMYFVNKG